MATTKPRITITLKESTYAVLKQMSSLTGNSMSYMVGDLVEGSQPVLERMVRIMAAAQGAQEQARDRVREGIEQAQAGLEKQLGLLVPEFERKTDDLVDQLERVNRRGRGRGVAERERQPAPRLSDSPSLTGGSGQEQKPTSGSRQARAKGKGRRLGHG